MEGGSQDLAAAASGLSSLRSRRVSVRASGELSVVNRWASRACVRVGLQGGCVRVLPGLSSACKRSPRCAHCGALADLLAQLTPAPCSAPIPDLVPPGGEWGAPAWCILQLSHARLHFGTGELTLPHHCSRRQAPLTPPPDPSPPGWKRVHGSTASLASMARSHASATEAVQPSGHSGASVLSHLARLSHALGSRGAMYHLDTGAANEHVPMNDQHYYLPFWQVGMGTHWAALPAAAALRWCPRNASLTSCLQRSPPPWPMQRVLIRSIYVLLCTIVACVIPFFNAIVGLVGAITYFPREAGGRAGC